MFFDLKINGLFSLSLSRAFLLFAALSGIFLFSTAAQAGTVEFLGPAPTNIGGGQFRFDYRYVLSASERLDPAATNGATCPGPGNTLVQCNPTGTFFTIYDIPNLVSVTAPAPWTFTTQLVGITPSTVQGQNFDSPNLVNVSFFYDGPIVPGPAVFPGFSIVTTCGGILGSGSFSSQSTKNVAFDPTSGTTIQDVGSVPSPACAVTSAPVSIGGRVLTARGRGIAKALVSMTDESGKATYAMTNAFGYYRFTGTPSGETYTFQVRSKFYRFTPSTHILNVTEDFDGLNFVASP
ncbi:MAG TPA: carboxypeptidase-like regulatory domain-containing protein [Pyrinomonadaceae bacterium]|nr:carboxypeptidase-like regulatory domain-containing protein [Pyrinomonadaceae bacterium]